MSDNVKYVWLFILGAMAGGMGAAGFLLGIGIISAVVNISW